jgi:hypothetical protein
MTGKNKPKRNAKQRKKHYFSGKAAKINFPPPPFLPLAQQNFKSKNPALRGAFWLVRYRHEL